MDALGAVSKGIATCRRVTAAGKRRVVLGVWKHLAVTRVDFRNLSPVVSADGMLLQMCSTPWRIAHLWDGSDCVIGAYVCSRLATPFDAEVGVDAWPWFATCVL